LACGAVDHQAIVCGENERTFREFREVWDKALVFSLANVGGAIAQSPGGRLSFWFEMIAALEGEPMKTTKYALAVALVLIALAPSAVRADSIVFDASGTFADGSTMSGTVTIDTTGVVTAASLSSSLPNAGPATFIAQTLDSTGTLYIVSVVETIPNEGDFNLVFPTATLIGYGGGGLCSIDISCPEISDYFPPAGGSGPFALTSGTLTAVPEPSTVALLGTGLLGLVGVIRRKRLA